MVKYNLLAAAMIALTGCATSQPTIPSPTITVPAGNVRYNNGPLTSSGFYACTAVVFDIGSRGIMAHTAPSISRGLLSDEKLFSREQIENLTFTDNVVEKIYAEAKRNRIPIKNPKVHIRAADKESLAQIVEQLQRKHIIPETSAIYSLNIKENPQGKTFTYNPAKDIFINDDLDSQVRFTQK